MILDSLNPSEPFVIFGAQVIAYGAYTAIKHLTGRLPDCFMVSSLSDNPREIDGVPVWETASVSRDRTVIVGVTELVQKDVLPMLRELGFQKLLPLTQHEEHLLMRAYYDSLGLFPALDTKRSLPPVDLALYEVRNHRDKPLQTHPSLFPFEHPIQAGAALTETRIAALTDDTGANISQKNIQYCEMTASYWVWKHSAHDWKGIEHYRRHLLVRPEQLREEIDAVLPLPYLCWPDESAQFLRFVERNVWDALLAALKTLHPGEYDRYLKILRGPYQYTYNLVCARRAVFDEYCDWFFRITEYMETLTNLTPSIGNTRALSYVAEVLTNLYFLSNQNRLRLRHAEKAIYV